VPKKKKQEDQQSQSSNEDLEHDFQHESTSPPFRINDSDDPYEKPIKLEIPTEKRARDKLTEKFVKPDDQ
jgi:hypothetical protein